jgi:radical SAM superfamily enzyme YgiQ (UPF0313 family)
MKVLLISPPFVQLNSAYSALPFLKGVLASNDIESGCIDLGIRIANRLFSKEGIERLFEAAGKNPKNEDLIFFVSHMKEYTETVGSVISFLKGNNPVMAENIIEKGYLPEWKMSKSAMIIGTQNAFDYARYRASLYLEDIFLFYKAVCPDYGLSKYGESLAVSPPVFDGILRSVLSDDDMISKLIIDELDKTDMSGYDLTAFTVPFPGTLIGALKSARYIKEKYPEMKIALGGGYVNTELRSLRDKKIFDFVDFICLDDGEIPLLQLSSFISNRISEDDLVRTYFMKNGEVVYSDNSQNEISFKRCAPDYSGIVFSEYIPVIETLNPMMKLWSEKDTLKLRLAKGCYWHKCEFCDTSLPYIKKFAPEKIDDIIGDIKKMVNQTGITRFHFTDEAIPPALAIRLSAALIRENIAITWWGNVRFDPAFTEDACVLLNRAGCIAAVGGLESCCPKTLENMNKGISIGDAVKVIRNFKSAGILVHAYMIYGFPMETRRDLADSAEILRQLFSEALLDSAYWHRFALTRHSNVFRGRNRYKINVPDPDLKPFANNDIPYIDNSGESIDEMGPGLRKAVYNWMLGSGTGLPIASWFETSVPKPTVKKNFVRRIIEDNRLDIKPDHKIVWLGPEPKVNGKVIKINGADGSLEFELPGSLSSWLAKLLEDSSIFRGDGLQFDKTSGSFPKDSGIKFSDLLNNEIWDELQDAGLLIISL